MCKEKMKEKTKQNILALNVYNKRKKEEREQLFSLLMIEFYAKAAGDNDAYMEVYTDILHTLSKSSMIIGISEM